MSDMVNLTIEGRAISVPVGTSILEAAKHAGVLDLGERQTLTTGPGGESGTIDVIGVARGRDIEVTDIAAAATAAAS